MKLSDAGVILLDCDHKTPEAVEVGRPYIGIPQMTSGRIDFSSARQISEDDFVTWNRKTKYQRNDVVLSRRTNPGVTAIDDTGTEFALGQNLVLLRANGKRVDPPFLRWLVRTPEWWEQIEKFMNVGAVFSSLRCRDVPSFELTIPPLPEQRAIAATLGALDDKIELNRKMNATLEAMARALFRDWFVDFGPTRTKMEARAPYLAPDLWSLFPDRLSDEDKPTGWEVSTIGDEVRVVGGSTPSTKEPDLWDGGINWATPKDLSNLVAPVLLETARTISAAGLAKISSGQLPVGSLLLSSRAPIGYLAIAEVPVSINQGFIGMICDRMISNVFAWLWTLENMEAILAKANGSTFQEISKGNFRSLPVVVPSAPVMHAFDAIAQPLYERIAKNERESRTLAQTRDLLLPQLMSGQILVQPDAKAG
ncbi:MAG TPA: restriction endonuclease subunit S [Albidovulum sp.]|uniref:restriction endonuclease subunit S n=1 Tax=Albidovulum sp. TaxID=1872424 RepID=UPI002BF5F947|nr:restriction endonuclease subunit S [Albidovulum sp.]